MLNLYSGISASSGHSVEKALKMILKHMCCHVCHRMSPHVIACVTMYHFVCRSVHHHMCHHVSLHVSLRASPVETRYMFTHCAGRVRSENY